MFERKREGSDVIDSKNLRPREVGLPKFDLAVIENLDKVIAKKLASGMTEDQLLYAAERETPQNEMEEAVARYIRAWVLRRRKERGAPQ
jgi:hypothetical protein